MAKRIDAEAIRSGAEKTVKDSPFLREVGKTLGGPAKTFLSFFFRPQAKAGRIPQQVRDVGKKAKTQSAQHFYNEFIGEIAEGTADPERAAALQENALLFQAALTMHSLLLAEDEEGLNRWLNGFGLEGPDSLPYGREMAQRGGPVERALLKSLKRVGETKWAVFAKFLRQNKGKVDLRLLMEKMHELFEGDKSPENRERIRKKVMDMFDVFKKQTEDGGKISQFADSLTGAINAAFKEDELKGESGDIKERMEFEEYRSSIRELLRKRAPREGLHKLFLLRGLTDARAFHLIASPEGKALLRTQDETYHPENLYRHIANQYRQRAGDISGDARSALERDKTNTLVTDQELCRRLIDTPLGRQASEKLELNTHVFADAVKRVARAALEHVAPDVPERIGSLDELVKFLEEDPDIVYAGGLTRFLADINGKYDESRQNNAGFWQKIDTIFERNKDKRGSLKRQAENKVAELVSRPRYEKVPELFDVLVNVVQKQYERLANRDPHRHEVEKAITALQDIHANPEQGFRLNIPGVESDLRKLKSVNGSYFNDVIRRYIQNIPHVALADLEDEIRDHILEPLAVMLGTCINPRKAFNDDDNLIMRQTYLTEKDFDLSGEVNAHLRRISNQALNVKAAAQKEEGEKEEGAEEEVLSEGQKKDLLRIIPPARARIIQIDKEEKKRKEKEEQKRERKEK